MKSLVVLITILFIIPLSAQDFGKAGQWELSGNVSFTSETSVFDGETAENSTSTFTVEPMLGVFVYDCIELGLMPMFQTQSHGDNSVTTWGLFAVPQYVFRVNKMYPYIGAFLGYASTDADFGEGSATMSGFSYGAVGGVKFQVAPQALLNIGLQYLLLNMEPEDWDGGRIGMNQFAVVAGFSIFLN